MAKAKLTPMSKSNAQGALQNEVKMEQESAKLSKSNALSWVAYMEKKQQTKHVQRQKFVEAVVDWEDLTRVLNLPTVNSSVYNSEDVPGPAGQQLGPSAVSELASLHLTAPFRTNFKVGRFLETRSQAFSEIDGMPVRNPCRPSPFKHSCARNEEVRPWSVHSCYGYFSFCCSNGDCS